MLCQFDTGRGALRARSSSKLPVILYFAATCLSELGLFSSCEVEERAVQEDEERDVCKAGTPDPTNMLYWLRVVQDQNREQLNSPRCLLAMRCYGNSCVAKPNKLNSRIAVHVFLAHDKGGVGSLSA